MEPQDINENFQEPAIYFIFNSNDKMVLPCFDISKLALDAPCLTPNFLSEWRLFLSNLQKRFLMYRDNAAPSPLHNLHEYLIKLKYTCTFEYDAPNGMGNAHGGLMLSNNFYRNGGGVIFNFPDLFDADNKQIQNFLEKTKMPITDILIRHSNLQKIVNMKINPFIFYNLQIDDMSWFANLAIAQNITDVKIWISIVIRWNYVEHGKHAEILSLIEKYCLPKILECQYYLMLYDSALSNVENLPLINWCKDHKNDVIWDEDLIADTPYNVLCNVLRYDRYFSTISVFSREMSRHNIF